MTVFARDSRRDAKSKQRARRGQLILTFRVVSHVVGHVVGVLWCVLQVPRAKVATRMRITEDGQIKSVK
jgi:hypothetical protein